MTKHNRDKIETALIEAFSTAKILSDVDYVETQISRMLDNAAIHRRDFIIKSEEQT